ncbi:MAG: hypothetical protein AB1758_13265, partial [Candidatus Eremiobacterota bacterium]
MTLQVPERTQDSYRPDTIVRLFVVDSRSASFYGGDSKFTRAMREAFAAVRGPDVPTGHAFLDYFRRDGNWVWDLPDSPSKMPGAVGKNPSRAARCAPRLADLLRESSPRWMIAVQATLDDILQEAAFQAGLSPKRVQILPFPLHYWIGEFTQRLAALLRRESQADGPFPPMPIEEAIRRALQAVGSQAPAREVANEL